MLWKYVSAESWGTDVSWGQYKKGLLKWLRALFFLAGPFLLDLVPLRFPDHPGLHFPLAPLKCPILRQTRQCSWKPSINRNCTYDHHLIVRGPNFWCLPHGHLTKLRNDSVLTKAVMGVDRLLHRPSFSVSTRHASSALLPWLTPGGTTQENDRNVCVFMSG